MSLLNNPNWIGFDGTPITGRVPPQVIVSSQPPGLILTPEQQGQMQHAFKLFADAVAVSAIPDGFHVQHRDYPQHGMSLRMVSNLGQQRVFAKLVGEESEPAPYIVQFQLIFAHGNAVPGTSHLRRVEVGDTVHVAVFQTDQTFKAISLVAVDSFPVVGSPPENPGGVNLTEIARRAVNYCKGEFWRITTSLSGYMGLDCGQFGVYEDADGSRISNFAGIGGRPTVFGGDMTAYSMPDPSSANGMPEAYFIDRFQAVRAAMAAKGFVLGNQYVLNSSMSVVAFAAPDPSNPSIGSMHVYRVETLLDGGAATKVIRQTDLQAVIASRFGSVWMGHLSLGALVGVSPDGTELIYTLLYNNLPVSYVNGFTNVGLCALSARSLRLRRFGMVHADDWHAVLGTPPNNGVEQLVSEAVGQEVYGCLIHKSGETSTGPIRDDLVDSTKPALETRLATNHTFFASTWGVSGSGSPDRPYPCRVTEKGRAP